MTQLIVLLGLLILVIAVFIVVLRRIEHEGMATAKEEKEEKKEETQKDSSSVLQVLSGGVSSVLSKLIWFAIVIALIFLIWKIGCKVINTIDTPSPVTDVSEIQEKDEWRYCQKRNSFDEWECEYNGEEYKIREMKHIPEKELSFEVCWGFGCGKFQSDVGSPETGWYKNYITREEGRFEGLEWTGIGFTTGRMICKKNCKSKGYLFTLDKK